MLVLPRVEADLLNDELFRKMHALATPLGARVVFAEVLEQGSERWEVESPRERESTRYLFAALGLERELWR